MLLLMLGLGLFLGVHSIAIVARGLRAKLTQRWGTGNYKALYSLVALVGLALIVYGYDQARGQSSGFVYAPPTALRHLSLLLMVPVFPLLIATYLPSKTAAKLKHPMLVAVKTWATAHLLANGHVADLLLFGSFLVWAVVDRISLKRRNARTASSGPIRNDVVAWSVGIAVYIVMLVFLHRWLFGISPVPRFGF